MCTQTAFGPCPSHVDDTLDRYRVVQRESEYAGGDSQVNAYECHAAIVRRWRSQNRGVSTDRPPFVRPFQLRKRMGRRTGDKARQLILETA